MARTALEDLRRLVAAQHTQACSDGQLLLRFAAHQEAEAFALLVQRHGRLVWGVCNRVLGHHQDAEDAFQATFMVLARKAGSIRRAEALTCWLLGTAHRVALRARRDAATRRRHEQRVIPMQAKNAVSQNNLEEVMAVLDEEVQQLPAKQRAVFTLCSLEGKSLEEAGRQLGWKVGTVSGTLARARQALRGRLQRRGVTLSAMLTAAALARETAAATLRLGLVSRAVHMGIAYAAHRAGSTLATALADRFLRGMLVARSRTALSLVVFLSLLVVGGGVFAVQAQNATAPPKDERSALSSPVSQEKNKVLYDQAGDALPPGALARLGTVRLRHGGRIYSVALSADGKLLASRGLDRTVRLWDAASGKELRSLRLADSGGWHATVTLAPDSKLVATAEHKPDVRGGAVVIWDAATGKELRRLRGPDKQVDAVAFAPVGRQLAAVCEKTIHLWNPDTGAEIRQLSGHSSEIERIAYSTDGKMLAAGSWDKTVRLWNTATGKEVCQLQGLVPYRGIQNVPLNQQDELFRLLASKRQHVMALAFSPDAKTLAAAINGDGAIRLWDTSSGKELPGRLKDFSSGGVTGLAFRPDGKTLVAGDWDGTVRPWDWAAGKEQRSFAGQSGPILALALAADGKTLAVSGYASVRLWDLAEGEARELVPLPGHHQGIGLLAISPDGKTVASAADTPEKTVYLWDTATGKQTGQIRGPSGSNLRMSFTADGKRLMLSQGPVVIAEADTGNDLFRSPVDYFSGYALSPDGRIVCETPDQEGMIVLREAQTTKELRRLKGHLRTFSACVFSPDGVYLAAAFHSEPRMIVLWEVATGKKVWECRTEGEGEDTSASTFMVLAFSPDSRILASGSFSGTVRLWEVATGRERRVFRGHQASVVALRFSPDGRRLISGGADAVGMVWGVMGATR